MTSVVVGVLVAATGSVVAVAVMVAGETVVAAAAVLTASGFAFGQT